MKYKGRFASIIILILYFMVFQLLHMSFQENHIELMPVFGAITLITVIWYGGKKYDEAKFLAGELEKNKNEIQNIINNLPAAIWSKNFKKKMNIISEGFEKIYMIPTERFRHDPDVWKEVTHPEHKEFVKIADKEFIEGFREKAEYKIIRGDGETRWVQSRVNTVIDSEGNLESIYGVLIDVTDRKNIEKELIEAEDKYRSLVENSLIGVFIYQEDKITFVNRQFEDISGYSSSEICSMNILDILPETDKKNLLKALKGIDNGNNIITTQMKGYRKDGKILDVELNCSKIIYKGKPAYIGTLKDISKEIRAIEAIKENEKILKSIFDNIQDGMCLLDKDLNILKINKVMDEKYNTSVLIDGKKCYETYYDSDKPCENCPSLRVLEEKTHQVQVKPFKAKDGTEGWIELNAYPLFDENNEIIGIIEQLRDITERKVEEDKINKMAYHDALTGLPNRYLLNDYVERAMSRARRRSKDLGIMFIDLDRFKMINDTMGHNLGDMVLQEVAKRLLKCVRRDDIVSRHGGDEFIILMEEIDRPEISKAAQRILKEISKPIHVGGREVYTTPSIGISMYPEDSMDVETLIKYADTAMYLAKDTGKNNYKFYTSSLNEAISRKMEIENGLRRALELNEFKVFYQPQIDFETNNIIGLEALIRWQHPKLGIIPPNEFIPLAEETGLILPIGKWVLERVCRQSKEWQEKYDIFIPVSVNISGRQLEHFSFIKTVRDVLKLSELEAKYLQIEITESTMQNTISLPFVLGKLRTMGIKVSVDDFGTGYSSLSLLKKIPIDRIKIDKSFTSEIFENDISSSLVITIINMAKNLNLEIIAEGVETKDEEKFLHKNGCSAGQGYLYGRPVNEKEIIEIMKNYPENMIYMK